MKNVPFYHRNGFTPPLVAPYPSKVSFFSPLALLRHSLSLSLSSLSRSPASAGTAAVFHFHPFPYFHLSSTPSLSPPPPPVSPFGLGTARKGRRGVGCASAGGRCGALMKNDSDARHYSSALSSVIGSFFPGLRA